MSPTSHFAGGGSVDVKILNTQVSNYLLFPSVNEVINPLHPPSVRKRLLPQQARVLKGKGELNITQLKGVGL